MSLFNKIKSVFNSSSDDVPDAQTIYFKNGEMYKVSIRHFSINYSHIFTKKAGTCYSSSPSL